MIAFATAFITSTFIIGSFSCCLALWTIQKSTLLKDSFGLLCKHQMLADLSLLFVSTFHSLTPTSIALPDGSLISIIITSIAEISYHYSGAMHDLFAVNRFVCIVFPSMKQAWRKNTPKILSVCAIITIFHTLIMMVLDSNLYWMYDRETHIWRMTDTEWTEFYVKYFEVYWSTCEIVLIGVLDSVTLSKILFSKAKIHLGEVNVNRSAETRLILQSFCQCIPTTTVNIIFFFVLPYTISPNLKIMYSSIWIVTNTMDAFIIILFHLPHAIATNRKNKLMTKVSAVTASSEMVTRTHVAH